MFCTKAPLRFDTSIAVSAMRRARTSCWTGREGGRDASAVDKQCVRQFLTAQGMQGRRRLREEEEKLKYPLLLLLLFFPFGTDNLIRMGFFLTFFLTHA